MALALCLGVVLGAAPVPGVVTLLLGPDGHLHTWRYGAGGLAPLPETLARIDGVPVNDMAVSEDGRSWIVLPAVTPASTPDGKATKGTRRARAEGRAVLITSGPAPAPPHIKREIRFDGEGRRAVLSPDGKRAFVVSARMAADASPSQERAWLHEIDLESGRVLSSDHLEVLPSALAIDAAGTRIYLSYPGRIVSYTTRPLAVSWHYRSPGGNRAIGFRPGSQVLYAVRNKEIVLFDPAILAARPPEERRRHEDEATGAIPVTFDPLSLTFDRSGRVAAVHEDGDNWAYIDLEAGRVYATASGHASRPIPFTDIAGHLAMVTFPEGTLVTVNPPETSPVPEPTPSPSPTPLPSPTPRPFPSPSPSPTPRPFPSPSPTPLPGPIPPEPPAPEPSPPPPMPSPSPPPPMPSPTPHPIPPSEAGSGLSGRISGQTELVVAVVIYGPDSIIRESARVAPQADGTWSAPLPAPGTYRVVPVGRGARPLRAEPHFQTIQIGGEALGGLDFRILGTD